MTTNHYQLSSVGYHNAPPSGLRGVTTNINPSGVHNLPHLNSPTIILSIPENSPIPENSSNNSNQNSDGELLNIAGRSIFDHDKIH